MKKALFLAAVTALVCLGCSKNNGNRSDSNGENTDPNGGQKENLTVKTAAANLVLHLSFDDDKMVAAGEGVTLAGNKGQAALGNGFIGKAWTNKGGANTAEAYSKFSLAAGNALTKMESFTFTVWAKLPKDKDAKGGIISFNGTGVEAIWPSFVFLFDNISDIDLDDGSRVQAQQFNGRIDFLTVEGKPAMWPNCASEIYNQKDEWFQLARTYNAATGAWANYANGLPVNSGEFLLGEEGNQKPGGPVNAAFAADCNAFYVGGWASRIEGKASDSWQAYCPGSLDELRFYNKALAEDEILALYKEEMAINAAQE